MNAQTTRHILILAAQGLDAGEIAGRLGIDSYEVLTVLEPREEAIRKARG